MPGRVPNNDPGYVPPLSATLEHRAMVLGMCVRNAMEGTIHGGELGELSLTDEQMAVLNPIVRNAIATGLHALAHYHTDHAAKSFIEFQARMVPDYWETPQLLDDYTELWPFYAQRATDPEPTCRRCGLRITDVGRPDDARWMHITGDRQLVVGCRAASFTVADGWDESIPRSWKAGPARAAGERMHVD